MGTSESINPVDQDLVLVCKRLLAGELGVVAAARQITSLASRLHGDDLVREMFGVFVAIDSESDHLPVGPERRHWAQDVLVSKDAEIERYEESCRQEAFEAARKIIKSYEQTIAEPGSGGNR